MIPACVIRQGMEDVFKLTPKEYAEMLGISTSAVRKQRLKGQLKNEFLEKNGKYFYKVPERDRPNIVQGTPHNNPKFHGSIFRPKKYKSQYRTTKRRRNVPENETNYANAHNGWQLQQLNNMRQMARINKELSEDQIQHLTPTIFKIAKERHAEEKKKELQQLADDARMKTDWGKQQYLAKLKMQNALREDEQYKSEMRGRWYNHNTGEIEDFDKKNNPYADKEYY
tara:strand:+ start:2834 stop:3511 length:678 start_codon:yes stop_codon:yes gene_type:complete